MENTPSARLYGALRRISNSPSRQQSPLRTKNPGLMDGRQPLEASMARRVNKPRQNDRARREEGRRFYILDDRTCVGNCALFWAPDSKGYTTQLNEAGLYTEEEAKTHRDTDIPIPEELAKAASVTHVRV